jgi:dCMP deaminase
VLHIMIEELQILKTKYTDSFLLPPSPPMPPSPSSLHSPHPLTPKRIEWDEYFMSIAIMSSLRSPCERLRVGSVIVQNNRVISMGYNGYISGFPHRSKVVDDHEQFTVHSEINAISCCAKLGIPISSSSTCPSKIYITHYPCIHCFKTIASVGITEIVYLEDYHNNPLVVELAKEGYIIIRKYKEHRCMDIPPTPHPPTNNHNP